jgi:hypothetical protein
LHLAPFFGFMRPVNVSTDLVNRYIDKRQQDGASNATINRELAVLKRAFHLGRECTPAESAERPLFQRFNYNGPYSCVFARFHTDSYWQDQERLVYSMQDAS